MGCFSNDSGTDTAAVGAADASASVATGVPGQGWAAKSLCGDKKKRIRPAYFADNRTFDPLSEDFSPGEMGFSPEEMDYDPMNPIPDTLDMIIKRPREAPALSTVRRTGKGALSPLPAASPSARRTTGKGSNTYY